MRVLSDRWAIYRLKNLIRWQAMYLFDDIASWAHRWEGNLHEWRSANDREIETILWRMFIRRG